MSSILFSPYTIQNLTLKNRIVMAPMCMYSCENNDGQINDWHHVHYVSRAVGQVGLIIQEATAVTPQGRITTRDLGIWDDDHIDGLRTIVNSVKQHGTKIGIQLGHAGRKGTIPGSIIAPSPLPFNEQSQTPDEMTVAQIEDTIVAFQEGARRAQIAGYDVIEIHAAHGYLINQFLSPLTNQRTDDYGGTMEKRYRFLQEIISAIKSVWDGPLFVRISAHEYHDDGLNVTDYVKMCKWMKSAGIDLIDVSSGAVVPAKITTYPSYQVPFAEKIKHEVEIPTGAVGLITSGLQAEEILRNGRADLIFIGRKLLRDPYWPFTAAKQLEVEIEAPQQYQRGWI